MAQPKTAVLVWSLPEEPGFIAFLTRVFGTFTLCPLRFAAAQTARRLVPSDQLLDVSSLINASERARIDRESTDCLNVFYDALKENQNIPWLSCVDLANQSNWFYYLLYWEKMLTELAEQGYVNVVLYGPFSRGAMPGAMLAGPDILEILVDRLHADHSSGPSAASRIRHKAKSLLGQWINSHPNIFAQCRSDESSVGKPASLLVCAFDESDRRSQGHLLKKLLDAGVSDLRWVIRRGDRLPASVDEVDSPSMSNVQAIRDEIDGSNLYTWWNGRIQALSECHVGDLIWRVLDKVVGDVLCHEDNGKLAGVILSQNRNMCLRYHSISHLVARYRPKIIVGNSLLGPMVCVRAWARRKGVQFMLLPHGVQTYVRSKYAWDADRLGVMGAQQRDSLLRYYPNDKNKIFLAGGMHLAAQAQSHCEEAKEQALDDPWRACLLVRYGGTVNYPDSSLELEEDLTSLSRAITAYGGVLRIRCHPRQGLWDLSTYRRIVERLRASGADVEMSDPSTSLNRDLAESRVAVIRFWSGAGVVALYAQCPLLGWLPRPLPPESAEIIQGLPVCAEEEVSVAEEARRLVDDPEYAERILVAQKEYLAHLVAKPFGDPYEGAVEAIRTECADAAGHMKKS